MSTTTVPSATFNAEGNVRASASLAASGTANYDLDFSSVWEGIVHVKNTPGGTVAATRGLKVEVFERYGTSPSTGETAFLSFTLPSATASTAECGPPIRLKTGKYNLKITNLDGTNAVTVEITSATIDSAVTS